MQFTKTISPQGLSVWHNEDHTVEVIFMFEDGFMVQIVDKITGIPVTGLLFKSKSDPYLRFLKDVHKKAREYFQDDIHRVRGERLVIQASYLVIATWDSGVHLYLYDPLFNMLPTIAFGVEPQPIDYSYLHGDQLLDIIEAVELVYSEEAVTQSAT